MVSAVFSGINVYRGRDINSYKYVCRDILSSHNLMIKKYYVDRVDRTLLVLLHGELRIESLHPFDTGETVFPLG